VLSHGFVAPIVLNAFEELDVTVTLWEEGQWVELRERAEQRTLLGFELEHGVETERFRYNFRCLAEARRSKKTVLGRHAGFCDLFVPIVALGRADAVLVTGPFATARPESAEILERWRALTGRQGHPADPEFADYLTVTRGTLVLEGGHAAKFQRLVEALARLMAEEGSADAIRAEISSLRIDLSAARRVDRMRRAAREIVDERTGRKWASAHSASRLRDMGVQRFPEHVVVGLMVGRDRQRDPVDELLTRDALQHACVDIVHRAGNALSGSIGDHGITLLGTSRRKLCYFADEARSLARRRFGLDLHLGVASSAGDVWQQYPEALAAAEAALLSDVRLVTGSKGASERGSLEILRRELGSIASEKLDAVAARFDRYLAAVAQRCGHRIEPARIHLDAGFERLAEAVLGKAVAEAPFARLAAELERTAGEAATVSDLLAVYRRAQQDLVASIAQPSAAQRDTSLRRAYDHIRQHYAEPLSLARVARVAGFSRTHFSRLFHKVEKVTFEHYLLAIRIERAKQLLLGTELSLERVAQLAGLSSRFYLGRVFKRVTGETPLAYRVRARRTRGGRIVGNEGDVE
jgi:AraC-like DNA-binding protein